MYSSIVLTNTCGNSVSTANEVLFGISASTEPEKRQGTDYSQTFGLLYCCEHMLMDSTEHYFQTISVVNLELYCILFILPIKVYFRIYINSLTLQTTLTITFPLICIAQALFMLCGQIFKLLFLLINSNEQVVLTQKTTIMNLQ